MATIYNPDAPQTIWKSDPLTLASIGKLESAAPMSIEPPWTAAMPTGPLSTCTSFTSRPCFLKKPAPIATRRFCS